LSVIQIFGQDRVATGASRRLDDGGVPVGKLPAVSRAQSAIKQLESDRLRGKALPALDNEQDRFLVKKAVVTCPPSGLRVKLLQNLRGKVKILLIQEFGGGCAFIPLKQKNFLFRWRFFAGPSASPP